MLQGTLEEVRDDQGRDDMGKGQSRFIPVGVRKDKGLLELKNEDPAEITVIDQNLPGDEHLPSEVRHHRVVVGQLAGPMETGHDNVVIRIADGNEVSYLVRPSARSKVASMPVGVDVIFLIDEFHKIVAIARGSVESAHRAAEVGRQKSPLKSNLQHPRTADLETGKDLAGVDVCRRLGIMEQPYDRWKKEYGELRVDHTKRLKALEQENLRLKRMVADQALDLAILKEVAEDKF
jgi:putative transposase